jgi:hypothetical protein
MFSDSVLFLKLRKYEYIYIYIYIYVLIRYIIQTIVKNVICTV